MGRESDKIFLIGFMGSGKTTLAKKLAKKLSRPFFDLDQEIEKNEQLSVSQIFDKKGESYFRELEVKALKDIISKNEYFVFSLGGGTPCFFNNMKLIKECGVSIYLKYNSGILASRLIAAKVKRPLIKGLNEEELKKYITDKLSERERFYNQSNYTLAGNNLKVEDLIKLIQ